MFVEVVLLNIIRRKKPFYYLNLGSIDNSLIMNILIALKYYNLFVTVSNHALIRPADTFYVSKLW